MPCPRRALLNPRAMLAGPSLPHLQRPSCAAGSFNDQSRSFVEGGLDGGLRPERTSGHDRTFLDALERVHSIES